MSPHLRWINTTIPLEIDAFNLLIFWSTYYCWRNGEKKETDRVLIYFAIFGNAVVTQCKGWTKYDLSSQFYRFFAGLFFAKKVNFTMIWTNKQHEHRTIVGLWHKITVSISNKAIFLINRQSYYLYLALFHNIDQTLTTFYNSTLNNFWLVEDRTVK